MTELLALLIDQIYEAAAVPELWVPILEKLGQIGGGRGCVLVSSNPNTQWWMASDGVFAMLSAWFEGGWYKHNTRGIRLQQSEAVGFVRDIDIYNSLTEIDEDPHVRDFLRPLGFGWAVGTLIQVPSGDNLIFSVEKDFKDGPVTNSSVAQLNMLYPHLARAALLSARLGLERARAMADALESLGLPAAVLRSKGRVLTMNRLFEQYVPHVFEDRSERLILKNVATDRLFADAISKIDYGLLQGNVLSLPIPASPDRPAMAIHLVPVRGRANDIFLQAQSILIATPIDRVAVPSDELLKGLFDLTPAEAKVARSIARGLDLETAAKLHGVSAETVRTQLKSIFAKTGTTRQAGLVSMLAGMTGPVRGSE